MTHAQEAGGAYPANEQIESFTHQEVPPRPGPLSSVQYHNNSLWRKHGRFPRLRVSDYARRSALNARTQGAQGSPGPSPTTPRVSDGFSSQSASVGHFSCSNCCAQRVVTCIPFPLGLMHRHTNQCAHTLQSHPRSEARNLGPISSIQTPVHVRS